MRCKALVSIVPMLAASALLASTLTVAPAVWAGEQDAPGARPAPPPVVYLHGIADLEQLKQANPNHYERAQRILAASDELCKPGPEQVYFARFEAKNISCPGALLRTSNPPKREIGFTLDDVRYVALITVKDSEPRFRHVPAEPVQPGQQALPTQPDQAVRPDQPVHPMELLQRVQPVQPVDPAR